MNTIQSIGVASKWLLKVPFALMTKKLPKDFPVKQACNWESEKDDILERANWLAKKILVTPEKLLGDVPSVLGSMYGGQWAIYGVSMYAAALANISRLYPETKEKSLSLMEQLVEMALTPTMRKFDSEDWKEDPIEGLKGNKGHFTYLTTIGWMISQYKLAGGTSTRFDNLFNDVCDGINRRMTSRKDMQVPSFTNKMVWISDMACACVVLSNYNKLYHTAVYENTVQSWIVLAKRDYIHQSTGILIGVANTNRRRYVRGSYATLTNYWLTQLGDEEFARDQHVRTEKVFRKDNPFCGIKEFQKEKGVLTFDPNAGPMFHGISGSGTAIAIGSATYFGDWQFRYQLLRTAEIAGMTQKQKRMRHYQLSELAFVGEAMVLAMRTNIKF